MFHSKNEPDLTYFFSTKNLTWCSGCSKMAGCKAPAGLRRESYTYVRRAAKDKGNEADGRFSAAHLFYFVEVMQIRTVSKMPAPPPAPLQEGPDDGVAL